MVNWQKTFFFEGSLKTSLRCGPMWTRSFKVSTMKSSVLVEICIKQVSPWKERYWLCSKSTWKWHDNKSHTKTHKNGYYDSNPVYCIYGLQSRKANLQQVIIPQIHQLRATLQLTPSNPWLLVQVWMPCFRLMGALWVSEPLHLCRQSQKQKASPVMFQVNNRLKTQQSPIWNAKVE